MRPLSLVKYQPERSRAYLGIPSVVRLPDGALIVSHDYYGTGCPRNHESEESLTSVYRSEDDGLTWVNITHIMNCYWSTLFLHEGALWILGTSQQYGSIFIRRSTTAASPGRIPPDRETASSSRGGYYHDGPNYHCAPVAVTIHGGRIYKAFEDCTPCVWGTGFQACVISAPVDADLLDARHWTMSNKLPFDPAWVPKEWGEHAEARLARGQRRRRSDRPALGHHDLRGGPTRRREVCAHQDRGRGPSGSSSIRARLFRPSRLQGEADDPPRRAHRQLFHHRQRHHGQRASSAKLRQRTRRRLHALPPRPHDAAAQPLDALRLGGSVELAAC